MFYKQWVKSLEFLYDYFSIQIGIWNLKNLEFLYDYFSIQIGIWILKYWNFSIIISVSKLEFGI